MMDSVWHKYSRDVAGGKIVANRWTRLACDRHLRDLKDGHKRGLHFDEDAAAHAIDFFAWLKHSKGEWAGQTVTLEPWQQFVVASLYGWKRADGLRRFRVSYLEVARKNGKSTFASGIGLYGLVADDEPGAEIYTAATKRDQARITHSEATRMVKASPALRSRVKVFKDNLHIPGTASKFEPLGRDADSLDGLNIHEAIVDELHAHPNRELYDVIETATGSRRQPLIFNITTAGFDRKSLCYQMHEYTEKVLDGIVVDDTHFGVIYGLDPDDDWEDERNWPKANPNLGVSKYLDDLQRKAARAKQMPSALNAFLRLELNVWTQAETRWVPYEHWKQCGEAVDANGLRGRRCYTGMDLSSTTDIAAMIHVFPPESTDDRYQVLCRFWVPEEAMRERSKRDRVPYDVWVRQGFITATPGAVIDYDYILQQLKEDCESYDVDELAYDRWGATKLANDIDKEGITTLVQFGQGFASMSAPMKELEKLIVQHMLAHGNNPVLTWMAHNLVAAHDAAGNIKPDKANSIEKIDGLTALIMAIARAIVAGNKESVYEERGIRTL